MDIRTQNANTTPGQPFLYFCEDVSLSKVFLLELSTCHRLLAHKE